MTYWIMSDIRWHYMRGMFLMDLAASVPTQYLDCIDSIHVPGIKLVGFIAQDKGRRGRVKLWVTDII